MMDSKLRISLAQYDIAWEDKFTNLKYIESVVSNLAGTTDLIVLPEMSFTGFSMNPQIAEPVDNKLLERIKSIAAENQLAICGSILISENGKYYNRAFFITPDQSLFYDKRHLFRMGREGEVMTAGNEKLIFNYKGFNICLLVCYDLRFPVWSRNVNNEYDLAIYVANWPEVRNVAWEVLLKARAIENMCYVCGVNRVGVDNNKLNHSGLSMVINQRGIPLLSFEENEEAVGTIVLEKSVLTKSRENFPVWKDADNFEIKF